MLLAYICALGTKISNYFKEPSIQTEVENFLRDKNITNTQELDFWLQEYDYRKRMASKYHSNFDYQGARNAMYY
jgi:predicted DNA-binding protein (UPF0278 family)